MNRGGENLQLLTSSHGFDDYAFFDIQQNINGRVFPKLTICSLAPALNENILLVDNLSNCSLFRMLALTNQPFRWLVGIDVLTGTRIGRTIADEELDRLMELEDITGAYCVPVQAPGKRRGAFVFFKRRERPKSRYSELVLDAFGLFEQELATDSQSKSKTQVKLSTSERNCLVWCACGKTSGEIGTILSLSEHTVNHYFTLAGQKLGTSNRIHTVARAIQIGLIDLSELS